MARKRYSAKQIIHMLREAEIKLAADKVNGEVVRELGILEQTYYRWRKGYGSMQGRRNSSRSWSARTRD